MKSALIIIQVLVSVLLVISVLLQGRGAGLGSSHGGQGEFYRSKRGVEKILFRFSILLTSLFLALSVIVLLAR